MAKKFFNTSQEDEKLKQLAVDEDGMISAPSSFESLDESDLVITPKEEIETLDEIEVLDDELTMNEKKKEEKEEKKDKKESKKAELDLLGDQIQPNPMGGVVAPPKTINYDVSPALDATTKKKGTRLGKNAVKQNVSEVETPLLGNMYAENAKKVNTRKPKRKVKIPVLPIIFIILIIGLSIAFYMGNSILTCKIEEIDASITAKTTIKTYYMYNKAYMSYHKIVYDFSDIEDVNLKSFAANMESTYKRNINLKVEIEDDKVIVTFNKFIKGLNSKGYKKDKANYVDNGLTCS